MLIIFSTGNIQAQDTLQTVQATRPDTSSSFLRNFLLTGNGYINLEKTVGETDPLIHLAVFPVLLWKISGKLFFEGAAEIKFEDEEVTPSLEFATLHYELNKYITIGAGKFLTPLGIYRERLHPNWINKFPEAPLGFSHEGGTAGTTAEIGLEVRGGIPVGSTKINYALYVSNGPVLPTEPEEGLMPGMLENSEWEDNNNNKAVGGRIGFLPLSNSSLEVGISNQYAKPGDKNDELYSEAISAAHAFDLSYVTNISSLKSMIDIKSEYNFTLLDQTGSTTSLDMDSMSNLTDMAIINKAFYVQLAIRPAMSQKKIIQKLELAFRYSLFTMTEPAMDETYSPEPVTVMPDLRKTEFAIGLNYWFSWRSVIKFAYMTIGDEDGTNESVFMVQLALAHPKINFKRKNK